jgi:hypothetical protein
LVLGLNVRMTVYEVAAQLAGDVSQAESTAAVPVVGNVPPEELEAAYRAQHQPSKTVATNR